MKFENIIDTTFELVFPGGSNFYLLLHRKTHIDDKLKYIKGSLMHFNDVSSTGSLYYMFTESEHIQLLQSFIKQDKWPLP